MEHPEQLNIGKKPAPGELVYVQGFINTYDLEAERDELGTPESLHAWLVRHGFLTEDSRVSRADVERTTAVREALRALTLANNGEDLDPGALALLNEVAGGAPLEVSFTPEGHARLAPAVEGVEGALAQLLAVVFTAMAEGAWERLKACLNDACHWVFYDHSKNRSGTWCTMAVCGSRMKVRAYRQRQAEALK